MHMAGVNRVQSDIIVKGYIYTYIYIYMSFALLLVAVRRLINH